VRRGKINWKWKSARSLKRGKVPCAKAKKWLWGKTSGGDSRGVMHHKYGTEHETGLGRGVGQLQEGSLAVN